MSPLLDVRLVRAGDQDLHAAGVTRAWTPVVDPRTGSRIEFLGLPAEVKDGSARWVRAIQLPHSRKELDYALLLEEYTVMPSDAAQLEGDRFHFKEETGRPGK